MDERKPNSVYDALHSLGIRWFEPRHARPNFQNDLLLKSWYKDVGKIAKRVGEKYGFEEGVDSDTTARLDLEKLLNHHGARIWCENPTCPRLKVGEQEGREYYRAELLYPRDKQSLIEKHLQLLKMKWKPMKLNQQTSQKSTLQSIEDFSSDTSSFQHTASPDGDALGVLERPRRNVRRHWSIPSTDSESETLEEIHVHSPKRRRTSWKKKPNSGEHTSNSPRNLSTTEQPKVRKVCLPCRKHHTKCDGGFPECQNCQRMNRICERAPLRASQPKVNQDVLSQNGNGTIRSGLSKNTATKRKKVYNFSCSECGVSFPQTKLRDHQTFGHNCWDLLPLDPKQAEISYHNASQRPFQSQGYWLSTVRARTLRPDEARDILQIREQVDETMLVVYVENSRDSPQRVNLQHCYSFENLAFRIAHIVDVDPPKIELLHVMLPYDFGYEVEPGDCHVVSADDEDTFKAFIEMIEKAWRLNDGEPRMLLFLCKVFLRQD